MEEACDDSKFKVSSVSSSHLKVIVDLMFDEDLVSVWIDSIDGRTFKGFYLAIDLVAKDFAEHIYEEFPIKGLKFNAMKQCTQGYCAIVKMVPNKSSRRPKKYVLCKVKGNDYRIDYFEDQL